MALPLTHVAAELGPAAVDALALFRSPIMPAGASYALLKILRPTAKPMVFPSLRALAARIHRDRGADALQLERTKIRVGDTIHHVTAVYAVDQVGERTRFIGYAWAAGRAAHEALREALHDLEPPIAAARQRAA